MVSTPDHTHAPASAMAMRMGKHCYCEKPLTHTVYEARTLARVRQGEKTRHADGHANPRRRQLPPRGRADPGRRDRASQEVAVWCSKGWGGVKRPTDTPPVPEELHWDVWLGPAPFRPYHPCYLPAQLAAMVGFRQRQLGDLGCHFIDLVFWALDLRHPISDRSQRTAGRCGRRSQHAGRVLRIRRPREIAAGQSIMARRRREGAYHRGSPPDSTSPSTDSALCSSARTAFCGPITTPETLSRGKVQRTSNRRRKPSPSRSAITTNSSEACKTGGPDDLQLRLFRRADRNDFTRRRGLSHGQKNRVGRRQHEGPQLPRSRTAFAAGISGRVEAVALRDYRFRPCGTSAAFINGANSL